MKLTYEDAYYYKLLLQLGFTKEVDNWILSIANNNKELEGIYLDLVCANNLKENSINEVISCLHNYIGDNKINDKELCDKLRLFIKTKLDNNEIDESTSADYLSGFAIASEKIHDKYWSDLYYISVYGDYKAEGFIDETKYNKIVRDFLETGKLLDSDEFWSKRTKTKQNYNLDKSRKIAFIIIIISIFLLAIYLYTKLK